MIHSMAGGNLGKVSHNNFAKVRILEGANAGEVYWYITTIFMLEEGDRVLVPLKDKRVKGIVERIDKNVSSFASPVPVKMAKKIITKITD